ncbi:MAG: outer membrane beta-barrel protein [Sphingobacteriaceae bacterium]|nr:outer membrane beta-barrel protein [Sphingobacteriaceae bacterium]
MRNSAWYHKLWRNKFDSFPIKDTPDASWAGMHKLLNEQMPASTVGGHGPNISTGAKLFKVIGYTLSVAVTASTIGYFAVLKPKNKQKELQKKIKPILVDSVPADSNKVLNYNEIADTATIKDSIHGAGDPINIAVGQNKAVGHDTTGLLKQSRSIENVTSPAAKMDAISSFKNGRAVTKRPDQFKSAGNSGTAMLKADSKADAHRNIVQKTDSPFTKGTNLLLAPKGFHQRDAFSHLPSSISILNQNRALQVYTANELQNSSSVNSNKREGRNRDGADRITPDKIQKVKNTRQGKIKTVKNKQEDKAEPGYNYGITTGMNMQKGNSSFYAGIFGTYALNKKWKLSAGLNLNSYQKIEGQFTHPSYYRPDSLPPFTITATRKVITIDIPLTAAYKLSKHIDLKAGPIISFTGKPSKIITRLNPIADPRDTLYHSKQIDSTLVNTNANKVNIGITGGISIHIKQFDINGSYQWLTPYKVSNSLGSFKQGNQVFRVGIGYRFK